MGIAYLNGEWGPAEDLRISPLDRGFVFGDGVYEVIPAYSRVPFFLDRHMARMRRSLDAIGIANPRGDAEWEADLERLIAEQDFEDQAAYIQVTRGVAPRKHAFPADAEPTVFMMSNPLGAAPASPAGRRVKLVTMEDRRWLNCHVKSVSLLGAVLSAQGAAEAGCDETLLLRDGLLTECSASNALVVKDGRIASPVRDNRILPGITLDVTLDIARKLGLDVEERDVTEEEMRGADEIWVSSSTQDIALCVELDGEPFGSGEPGEEFVGVCEMFASFKGKHNPEI